QTPVRGEFADGVVEVVRTIHCVIRPNEKAMRAREQALAPGIQKRAVAIEDDDAMLAPREEEDTIARIGGDRRDLGPRHARRELCPSVVGVVAEIAAGAGATHVGSSSRATASCDGSGSNRAMPAAGTNRKAA